MVRFLCILSLIVISCVVYSQDLSKTKTAKGIKNKMEVVKGKVIQQPVYKHTTDTAFIQKQDITISKLDSIIKKKMK
jgi:hypothetical protein